MPHAEVVQIIERSWRAIKPEDAEKLEFSASKVLKTEPVYKCPDCQQAMDKYGYMGLAAIPINRCDACSLLWLDSDELQNMVLALARSNYRSEAAHIKEWRRCRMRILSRWPVTRCRDQSVAPLGVFKQPWRAAVVAEALLDLFG